MEITRTLEFDAGHRIPNHSSKCRNIHGHRFKCELTLEGDLIETCGVSNEGMVLDFADIKSIANNLIDNELDHSFIAFEKDERVVQFIESEKLKLVKMPSIPTAENIAKYLFDRLEPLFKDRYENELRLKQIKLYETPNAYVVYQRNIYNGSLKSDSGIR